MFAFSLAPIAGYTDLPFRRICRRFGLRHAHTALIDAGALVHGNRDNDLILARGEDEDYLAVQLLGSRLDDIRTAAAILAGMDFDAVDFNMGCPVRKILRREAGAALMRSTEHATACLRAIRDAIPDRPLTVKTRILDENDPRPTIDFCLALQDCGIQAITIHGRLASRLYSGPVATGVIRAVREALRIPVIANGGIFSWQDAVSLAEATGCERLMVARGALGNPWLFRELTEQRPVRPSHEEVLAVMREHVGAMLDFYGEASGIILARKIILGYLCGRGYLRSLRAQAVFLASRRDFDEFSRLIEANPPHPL